MFSRVLYRANATVECGRGVQEPRAERTLKERSFEPMVRFWGQRLCHVRVANYDLTTLGSFGGEERQMFDWFSYFPFPRLTLEPRGVTGLSSRPHSFELV